MRHKKYFLGVSFTITFLAWISITATGQVAGKNNSTHDISPIPGHDTPQTQWASQESVPESGAFAAGLVFPGEAPSWRDFGLLKAIYR